MNDEGPSRFLNRELSWLAFNERVLALAADPDLPLLERAKFLAIFSRNLDEFFQVRVAGLKEQLAAGVIAASPDGRDPDDQLQEIHQRVAGLIPRQQILFAKEIVPELAQEGMRLVDWSDLERRDKKRLRALYDSQIQPALTPLAVDPAHPFPWISNLSLNLGLLVRDTETRQQRFARVKVPPVLPRLIFLEDGERFVPLEQLIAAHLEGLFPGMEIDTARAFRVTRDAALLVDEGEADDLLSAIQSGLHRRLRVNDAVRLEIEDDTPETMRRLLIDELEIDERDVYSHKSLIDLSCLWELHALDRPDLKEKPWRPVTQRRLKPGPDQDAPRSVRRTARGGTSWCTTRTTRSGPPSRPSSNRRPPTRK